MAALKDAISGNLFSNPLVIAEKVAGMLLDQRAIVLYEQPEESAAKSDFLEQVDKWTTGTVLEAAGADYIARRQLTELFQGTNLSSYSILKGVNMWGITYQEAEVNITSQLCQHPIEDGTKITDASIREPITAKVGLRLPTTFYTKIYKEIWDYYEKKKKIILVTKTATYRNLVIANMPYKLKPEDVDRPLIELTLQEITEIKSRRVSTSSTTGKSINKDTTRIYDDTSTENMGNTYANTIASVVDSSPLDKILAGLKG